MAKHKRRNEDIKSKRWKPVNKKSRDRLLSHLTWLATAHYKFVNIVREGVHTVILINFAYDPKRIQRQRKSILFFELWRLVAVFVCWAAWETNFTVFVGLKQWVRLNKYLTHSIVLPWFLWTDKASPPEVALYCIITFGLNCPLYMYVRMYISNTREWKW